MLKFVLVNTLKARCSRKCAVPLVSSVSALDPASIQTPTVEVCAQGEYSVATYPSGVRTKLQRHLLAQLALGKLTVKPFFKVVVWVFAPAGDVTGVAKPRLNGRMAELAARLRMPCARLKVSLLDAIRVVRWEV